MIQVPVCYQYFVVSVSFDWHTWYIYMYGKLNSLRPSDAIWRQWSWTTLAQVMACCLTAPSHYLNQCWLIIRGVLWHTSESSFAGIAQGIDSGYEFEKDILKTIFKSPRGQWVNVAFTEWWEIINPLRLSEARVSGHLRRHWFDR